MTNPLFITTAIPYVNSSPHLGHALEAVQADVLARHRRLRGGKVRFLSGTDDNAAKNVAAALAAGVPTREFVHANAQRFRELAGLLDLSLDDFISTSSDPRHAPGVHALWERSSAQRDFYTQEYTGLYCPGCEQFYSPEDLPGGLCAEHGLAPETATEENWFFRLTRYQGQIRQAILSGQVRIEPEPWRNEVLALLDRGLSDLSVSRPASRSAGWGVSVPSDPDQVVYVWWDALANYITSLGFGSDDPTPYHEWWQGSADRVHVVGKGITRFHAVYWLGLLLSASLPLPTTIFVHDYLTVDGEKISKSRGNAVAVDSLVQTYGVDALRWWLLRDVARTSTSDFTLQRLQERHDADLANDLGNLVNRTLSLVQRYRSGALASSLLPHPLQEELSRVPKEVDAALHLFDFRTALDAIWRLVQAGNQLVEAEKPWELHKAETLGDASAAARLDQVLSLLVQVCRTASCELSPFIPQGANRLLQQLGSGAEVRPPSPVFPRLRSRQ